MLILTQGNPNPEVNGRPAAGPSGEEAPVGQSCCAGSEARVSKRCEACGAGFVCASPCRGEIESTCWCARIQVDSAALALMREKYHDCLCEACLLRTAEQPAER